jgi:hypothetical protein
VLGDSLDVPFYEWNAEDGRFRLLCDVAVTIMIHDEEIFAADGQVEEWFAMDSM